MQTSPLITFIVAVYRIPDALLTACLRSIMAVRLDLGTKEIIVVDDGNEEDIAASWPAEWKEQIVLLRQPNQGAAAARNAALDRAQGEYIQIVDADDFLFPQLYSGLLLFTVLHKLDVMAFRSTSRETVADDGLRLECGLIDGASYMLRRNVRAASWGYIFRRATLGDLRFDPSLRHEEDELFTPQLLLRAKVVYSSLATPYFYRQREGSLTNADHATFINNHLPNFEYVLPILQHLDLPEREREAMDRRVAQLTMDYLYNVVRHTRSLSALNERIEWLRERSLYPLPDRRYTWKYVTFRRLVSWRLTRRLLVLLIR